MPRQIDFIDGLQVIWIWTESDADRYPERRTAWDVLAYLDPKASAGEFRLLDYLRESDTLYSIHPDGWVVQLNGTAPSRLGVTCTI